MNKNISRNSNSARKAFALHDNMTDTEFNQDIYWFEEVTSTMDKAKEVALNVDSNKLFAVVAESQTNARGTRGRTWISGAKNLLITISIPMNLITIPLTLTPLRIGTLIYPLIRSRVSDDVSVHVKWPNDILIDNRKVCGVLIELDNSRMVIGIGCNIGSSPSVESTGTQAGRPSTCLANYNSHISSYNVNIEGPTVESIDLLDAPNKQIAKELFNSIKSWLLTIQSDNSDKIITDFESHMDFNPQKLRNSYQSDNNKVNNNELGLLVQPLRINKDGTLLVKFLETNQEKSLIADYLW
eukprot:gene17488-23041_t